ncbi:NAD(P)H-hydrate dehydratase, partial [Chloroflexota bacterium]
MKILTIDQMSQADQDCAKIGLPTNVLMENAGKAVAEEVRRILGTADKQHILVLIGPGNNGGDGLVAARHLHDWGAMVSVYLCTQRPSDDPNLKLVLERKIICTSATEDKNLNQFDSRLLSANTVIDALFGTGKVRPLTSIFQQVLEHVKKAKEKRPSIRVIAVDLPSGLNADTGEVDPACLYADNTITLAFPKLGLFRFPGAERVGKLTIVDIGIPSHLVEQAEAELITNEWAMAVLPQRPLQANKGTFGQVLVVAGSINYIGAAYLACSGALRVGAGLVTLATATSLQPILSSKLTEVTYLPLPESQPGTISAQAARLTRSQFEHYKVLLLGCGLGQNQSTAMFIRSLLLSSNMPLPLLVLDADALNILAKIPNWWQQLTTDAILTPHPGEMSRLAGISMNEVQSDRVGTAKRLAVEWHKTIVLKGAYTVIAAPDGRVRISPIANPGLASAGTGDVLTGAIAGLAAQGLPPFDAAALG